MVEKTGKATDAALAPPMNDLGAHELAKECLSDCNGNLVEARALMAEKLPEYPRAEDAIINTGIRNFIGHVVKSKRRSSWDGTQAANPKNMAAPNGAEGLEALGLTYSLLNDYPLISGISLGDATRGHIEAEITAYRTNRQSFMVKEGWFKLILKKMGNGPVSEQVRDKLSHDQLTELKELARKG